MDKEENTAQILHDLRSQIRMSNRVNVFLLIMLTAILIFNAAIWTGYFNKTNRQSWYDVVYDMDAGSYDRALSTALKILKKTRDDWYAHSSVARVYLVKGDFVNAEKHYNIAYELFPTKENEDYLLATRRLIDRRGKKEAKKSR